MELCLYGPKGSIFSGPWPEYLRRKRIDNGEPLVKLVCIATSHDSTPLRLREEQPHLKLLALTDPGYVRCKSDGFRYVGPDPGIGEPGRGNSNPDMSVAQAIADHIAAGYPDAYWKNEDGTIAIAQPDDAVWHPIGRNLFYRGRMRNVLEVWGMEAARMVKAGIYDGVVADCHAGTLLSYGGKWRQMGLSDEAWRTQWGGLCMGMSMLDVSFWKNAYGPGGPRDSELAECEGYKVERPFEQGGTRDDWAWWGYIACSTAYGIFRSGLPRMTPLQAANSIIQVQPKNKTPEQQWELLKASFALGILYDIGYIAMHDTWGENEFWDPHSIWRNEVELWTRLAPVGPPLWKHWSGGGSLDPSELPSAQECMEMGDLYGVLRVVDPIGGQKYRLWLNPNGHRVGYTEGKSVRLVME